MGVQAGDGKQPAPTGAFIYSFSLREIAATLTVTIATASELGAGTLGGPLPLAPQSDVTLGDWFHSMSMEASPYATAACLVALWDTDLRSEMAKVNGPSVIFHATQDKICLFELAEAMVAGIKGAKLIQFENSGHGLFYEQREVQHRAHEFPGLRLEKCLCKSTILERRWRP